MTGREEFSVINLLRFVAAAWVLVFHAQIHFGELQSLSAASPLIGQGVLAMSLFFILSGFILTYRYKSFGGLLDAQHFYVARIARLYPVYLFMGIVTIWTLDDRIMNFPLADEGGAGFVIWAAIVFLMFVTATQAWFPSLFGVWNFGGSWSLSVEAFFYALFPTLRSLLSRASDKWLYTVIAVVPIIGLALTAGLVTSLTHEGATAIVFYAVPIYRLPEFVLGIAAFILFVERSKPRLTLQCGAAVAAVAGIFAVYIVGDIPGNIDYGGLFFLGFVALFLSSMAWRPLNLLKNAFNYLGHISYCVYIVQFGTVPLFKRYISGYETGLQWAIFIGANLAFAIIVYHVIEKQCHKPVLNLLNELLGKLSRRKSITP